MTEDEAKTKACHAAEEFNASRPFSPAPNDEYENPKCIGSACMAWRWLALPSRQQVASPSSTAIGWEDIPSDGYCGLASRP